MMRRAFLTTLALLLATPLASAAEQQHTLYLHEKPLHILPEFINANVGDTLVFTIENPEAPDKGPHNFLVCGDGKKFTESCDDRWAFTGMIQPGESAQLTFEVKEAGLFEYYCYIPGHKGGGMTGELRVAGAEESKPVPTLAPIALLAVAALAAIAWRSRR